MVEFVTQEIETADTGSIVREFINLVDMIIDHNYGVGCADMDEHYEMLATHLEKQFPRPGPGITPDAFRLFFEMKRKK